VNVELNLLSERREELSRLSAEMQRWGLLLLAVLTVGGGGLVGSFAFLGEVWEGLSNARRMAASLGVEERELSEKASLAATRLSTSSALQTARENMERLLGVSLRALNTVPTTLAISKVRVEVLGGKVTLTGVADAESLRDAQQFISDLKTQGLEAVMTSAKRNDYLGPGGVGFEFTVTGGGG
jgi:hypothetical protein